MRGQRKQKMPLSQQELQGLKEERKEIQTVINDLDNGVGAGTSHQADVSFLKRQAADLDREIENMSPQKLRGTEKDRLSKEEAELEQTIAQGMPTRDEMRYPTRNPGAVRKHMEWSRRNQDNIQRYVFIQRSLRPAEPKSIETLRRDK